MQSTAAAINDSNHVSIHIHSYQWNMNASKITDSHWSKSARLVFATTGSPRRNQSVHSLDLVARLSPQR